MKRSLAGSVVSVLGASGGLGSVIVAQLAQRGVHTILAGPHRDRLDVVAAALPPALTTSVACDIRDASCGDAIVSAAAKIGRLDGVINAAGVVGFGALVDTPDELIEEIFLINTLGPLWMMKRVAPLLTASNGFIVNISAVVAENPLPGMATYSASKAALTAADSAIAREFRRMGITVCDVRPPHTETGLALRPISGVAPKLPPGLDPAVVAATIVHAIESGATEVSSASFGG